MSPNTHKITTPVGKAEVEIKSWITGREAEFIDELMYEAVAVKADMAGKADIGNVDFKKIIADTAHRKIETFVISIGDSKENILDAVLNMHEDDYKFILDSIDEQRKKK
jgi:hypothetical protein